MMSDDNEIVKEKLLKHELDQFVLNQEDYQEQIDNQELDSEKNTDAPKPKILVQRVFHQNEKHVVEQKLDYVIASSEEEIKKHLFGGLFRSKYYKYNPDDYCKKHAPDLFEFKDESLVKLGDKFDCIKSFRMYVDGNAKQWKYYMKCGDSHRKKGKDTFVFQCVMAKLRNKVTPRGLRKRTFAVPKGNCPCRILLKPVPFDATDLTVIYVCNHHDHPLTDEVFNKLQHGRRLHPSIKAELMDLLSLEVDREVVKKYFESLTGFTMGNTFFANMLITMRKNKIERNFSVEKLKEMSRKIEKIKEELGMSNEEEYVDNDLISEDNTNKDKASQVAEVINVLKAVSAPIKSQRLRRSNPEPVPTPSKKRTKKYEKYEDITPLPNAVNNQSRLETRLQELKHDRETLQSIKHLQDSVRCETEKNPWVVDDVPPPNRNFSKTKRGKNVQKQPPVIPLPDIEPQAIIVENPPLEEDIVYENEITVMEANAENGPESIANCVQVMENCPESIANCVQVMENNEIELNGNNDVSYCIQYDDGGEVVDQTGQKYVLMLDDGQSLENFPDVQIQATQFATVSILSDENQKHSDVPTSIEQNNLPDVPNVPAAVTEEIHVMDESCRESLQNIEESAVFEVIQTNDKKLLPSKEFVKIQILKKPPKSRIRAKKTKSDKNKSEKAAKNSNNTEVTVEYIKDESEENTALTQELEDLEDNECYMIVVDSNGDSDNPDDAESNQDWMEGFEGYDMHTSGNRDYADSTTSDHVKYLDVKHMKNKQELDSCYHVKGVKNINFDDTLRNEFEESENSYSTYETIQSQRVELEKAVRRLQRQKHGLEKDIRSLLAKKGDLIEDITKLSRRKYTYR